MFDSGNVVSGTTWLYDLPKGQLLTARRCVFETEQIKSIGDLQTTVFQCPEDVSGHYITLIISHLDILEFLEVLAIAALTWLVNFTSTRVTGFFYGR